VALVSSGYFPTDTLDSASTSVFAAQTSLMVIDLETGTLIQELKTSTAPEFGATKTFGLSQPVVYDFGGDQVDDVAVAGDLAGNLWRFDLNAGKVNLMFTTYGNGGAALVGDQPISSMPTSLTDRTTHKPIFIVGTGKLLGKPDRTNAIPQQAFYGILDYGTQTSTGVYPVKVSDLVRQKITQDSNGIRTIAKDASATVPTTVKGWMLPLDVLAEKGERSQRRPFPLFSANLAILYTVIPKGDDPCNPGSRYGLMVVGGSSGGMPPDDPNATPGTLAGVVLDSAAPLANPVVKPGGGFEFPDSDRDSNGNPLSAVLKDALDKLKEDISLLWHRGAWRQLQQDNN
jgi:type IV pilus assembly protein PilY1